MTGVDSPSCRVNSAAHRQQVLRTLTGLPRMAALPLGQSEAGRSASMSSPGPVWTSEGGCGQGRLRHRYTGAMEELLAEACVVADVVTCE